MIKFSNVTKRYGDCTAINNLTINLRDKKIYCLLGRNGAGKTTLMKLLAGKLSASEGEIYVAGARVSALNMPENVRYIEAAKPQFNMRIKKLIEFAADVDTDFDMKFAMRMIEKFRLDKSKKYNTLSFGTKTMITTVISLASNADIILLDEPVLGFDAVMRKEFYELLYESFTEHPRIIIVSTHLVDEIASVCGQIIMIDNGKPVMNEDINSITEKAYKITGIKEAVQRTSERLNVLDTENIGKYMTAYVYDDRIENPADAEITDMSLQELFIKMVGGDKNE